MHKILLDTNDMSQALRHHHQHHHNHHSRRSKSRLDRSPATPTSPLGFIERIPFSELRLSMNETLGSGSFGTVFKGRWRDKPVAIKQFKTKEEIESFSVEVNQLSSVRHPNIISLYGSSTLPDCAYLIMEYAEGGSLNNLLHDCKQHQDYDLRHACSWAMQTARGVSYLHGIRPKPIMHRDLKPANLLLFSRGKTIKICDFGTACAVKTQMTSNTGSASYMAPEVFSTSSYLESGDVYSWSIIFWEILARQHPYNNHPYSNVYQILWNVQSGARPSELNGCPRIIWNLITRCWSKVPSERPTMVEVEKEMELIFSLTGSACMPSPQTQPQPTTAKYNNNSNHASSQHHLNHDKLLKKPHNSHHNYQPPHQPHPQLPQTETHNFDQSEKDGREMIEERTVRLYKITLHKLKLIQNRIMELEESSKCDKEGEEDLLNEFQELKRRNAEKKEYVERKRMTLNYDMKSCSFAE